MLAGLAAALVPLVIHLLNRARYRNVDWAAMMFLDAMEPRADHSARLKQWSLLAMRCGIIGLLAFGLSRPVMHAHGIPPQQPGRSAAVIVLDRSSSMSLNDNGRPRIDQARDAVYQLLSPGFKRGDDLWLVPLGDGDPAMQAYTTDPQDMAPRVRELLPPSGVADFSGGLLRALNLLAQSTSPNREIYIICDRQASSWGKIDAAFTKQWRQKLDALPWRPRVTIVPMGTEDIDNVALVSIHPTAEPLVAGETVDVDVTIRNFGSVPRASIAVSLSLQSPTGNAHIVARKSFSVPALSTVAQSFSVKFPEVGCCVLNAVLEAPGLTTDKTLNASFDVIKPVRVLIIDGDEREGEFQSASDFLRVALAPFHDPKRDPFNVDVLHPQMWGSADLSAYQVVMLANISSLNEAQARAVDHFAFDGGGVIVIPGDQSRAENYAQWGWLPAALSPPTPESDAGATEMGPLDPALGLPRFSGGRAEGGPPITVRRYFPASPREGASISASFGDGKPFLVSTVAGHGRVMLMMTPVDTDWNALPFTPVFLPLAQAIVSYAAAGPSHEHEQLWNLATGRPLVARLDGGDEKNVRIETPSFAGRPPFGVSATSGGMEVTFLGANLPGVYRISTRGANDPGALRFSVRTPADESDLTPLTRPRQEQIIDWLDAEWADPERRPVLVAQEASRTGWELWLPLLGAVMAAGVIELAATRRWLGRDT